MSGVNTLPQDHRSLYKPNEAGHLQLGADHQRRHQQTEAECAAFSIAARNHKGTPTAIMPKPHCLLGNAPRGGVATLTYMTQGFVIVWWYWGRGWDRGFS